MRRFYLPLRLFIAIVLVLTAALPATLLVRADAGSAYDLIAAVNAVRTGNGLPALEVDAILMGTAQATSDVMAATGNCTAIGNARGRIAAAGYGGGATIFATENIACGYNLSIETTVYTFWADATHMLPMTDSRYTQIGAGVTIVNDRVFYVIQAAYVSGGSYTPASVSTRSGTAKPLATAGVVKPVITATPGADGSIIHEVQPGQALWSIAIAYGVKIAEITTLNKLSPNPVLSIGQKLTIRAAATATPSPTMTLTPRPPTRTPTRTPTPITPTATATITLTPTSTLRPFLNIQPPSDAQRNSLGISIIAVSGIGLLVVAFSALRKKK